MNEKNEKIVMDITRLPLYQIRDQIGSDAVGSALVDALLYEVSQMPMDNPLVEVEIRGVADRGVRRSTYENLCAQRQAGMLASFTWGPITADKIHCEISR